MVFTIKKTEYFFYLVRARVSVHLPLYCTVNSKKTDGIYGNTLDVGAYSLNGIYSGIIEIER
jgi:hypothetical protein